MLVYSSSLLDTPSPSTLPSPARETEFLPVLKEGLDPALEMLEKMSEFRPIEWDKNIFRINSWEAVLGVLEGFDFVGGRVEMVEELCGEAVGKLIDEHVSSFRCGVVCRADCVVQYANLAKESGLESTLTALETNDESVSIPLCLAYPH